MGYLCNIPLKIIIITKMLLVINVSADAPADINIQEELEDEATQEDMSSLKYWQPTFCDRTGDFCAYGETHVACNKNNWYLRCLKPGAVVLTVSRNFGAGVSDKYNDLRDRVASGIFPNINFTATRMGAVIYDEDLAHLAELNCNNCEFAYDACFGTPEYPNMGVLTWGKLFLEQSYNAENVIDLIILAFDAWAATGEYGDGLFIREYQLSNWRAEKFATLMMEENNRVGCAALHYRVNNFHKYYVTCVVPTKCAAHRRIFDYDNVGTAGSKCTSGNNENRFTNLCSPREQYNYRYRDKYY